MRKLLLLIFLLLPFNIQGQRINTKEIKETFTNGFDIFNIITDNLNIKFSHDLDYDWYNESSGHQYSTGASGGYLLHGKYSRFDEKGKLIGQGYYKFGLADSLWLSWDNNGKITDKKIFKDGIRKYWWFYNEKYIYEIYGSEDKPDYKRSLFTLDNILISEVKCISANPIIWETKIFNEDNKKLIKHSFQVLSNLCNYGPYKEFFDDGSIKCIGNYDKNYKLGLKVGLWLVFNVNSNKIDSISFKLSEKILNSAGDKEIGSLVFSPDINEWIKYGIWYHIDKKGSIIEELEMGPDPVTSLNRTEKSDIIPEAQSNTIRLLKNEAGLFEVPILLNGVLKINFIIDSGASEVSLSPDVAITLIRTGTISEQDWLPDQMFLFADGTTAKSKRFLIRKLIIGNQTLINIEASISKSVEAPILIGQNVLQKLGNITIDYENGLLIINP